MVCEIHEYPKPVIIKNTVQMILRDVAKYKSIGSPPLEGWVKEKLERIIREGLFKKRYLDILFGFQTRNGADSSELISDADETAYASRIKNKLRQAALNIGYDIEQLITVPDLKPLKLRDKFSIVMDGEFVTKVSNVKVKLSIVVTARIEDLRDVKEHLNRLQDVEELMQEAIGEVVRQYLHTIDPERFYVRFSFADKNQEKRSIEEELKSLITERLKKGFAADIISVTPKMVNTDLIERLRKLRNEICNFKVEVHPLDASEPVTFCGAYQIEGVSINEQNGKHPERVVHIPRIKPRDCKNQGAYRRL